MDEEKRVQMGKDKGMGIVERTKGNTGMVEGNGEGKRGGREII